MPERYSFDYAIVRVVPRVEREEFINVGVILFCRARRFLKARFELVPKRLDAFAPGFDITELPAQFDIITKVCTGGINAGYIGQLSQQERFHWLVAPRSTVVQTSRPHSGFCTDPAATLEHLLDTTVKL